MNRSALTAFLLALVVLVRPSESAASMPLLEQASEPTSLPQSDRYDVVIYGGSPSGLSAAIQAARLGESVLVVEPYSRIGGMMTAGLTRTDMGDWATTGGTCREFFERLGEHYKAKNTKRQKLWHFEPGVGESVFWKMLKEAGKIEVVINARLSKLQMKGGTIAQAQFTVDGKKKWVKATVFIDATYEGDLAAEAGAPYMIGRESKEQFGEPHALDRPDKLLQAYCYRLTVTDDPHNRVPIAKPVGYDPKRFKLLGDYVNEKNIKRFVTDCLFAKGPVNRKYDGNAQWRCWVSTDFAAINADYPEGSWERREEIYSEYRKLTMGWMYFLQNDPSVPEVLRKDALRWGLPRDEHVDTDHIPYMIYVREARRITGHYVFTELDAVKNIDKPDSIGFGKYAIDSHHVVDYHEGNLHLPRPEGNVVYHVRRPYQIPYRILVPKKVDNLLVSLCVSSTHRGYGTLRMEPEYMKMGQAAGIAAHMCVKNKQSPKEIDVPSLQEMLRDANAVIDRN